MKSPPNWRGILAVLVSAIAAAVVITVSLTNGTDDHGKPTRTVTVTLGGPGRQTVTLPPAAQAQATVQAREDAAGNDQAAHSDLNDSAVAPVAPAIAKANDAEKPAGQAPIPANPPLAAQNVPGCRTLLVRNFSSRGAAPVLLFVIHYTVSTDNGWDGVLANVKWFDTAAASASSNYIIDRKQGDCALTVAEQSKAWAQAGFNPWALSVEVTATGGEGSLVEGAGKARLLALMKRAHDVYHVPYRHGAVSGCQVTRSGFVIHKDLGACGGGHVDVTPYSIDPLIAELAHAAASSSSATSPSSAKLTAGETAHVNTLEAERRTAKRHGGWSKVDASHLRNASAAKAWLRDRVKLLKASKAAAGRTARIDRLEAAITG